MEGSVTGWASWQRGDRIGMHGRRCIPLTGNWNLVAASGHGGSWRVSSLGVLTGDHRVSSGKALLRLGIPVAGNGSVCVCILLAVVYVAQ